MKLLALGRALSSSHHPDRDAEFTLPDLHGFCEWWFFEVYPSLVHRTLGQPPDDLLRHSLAVAGERLSRYVRFDQGLRVLLAPTPSPPCRVVDPGRGITIDYLRFWCDAFASGDLAGQQVDVNLDPADCSVVFARVHGQWVSCDLAEGREYLLGRSWCQIQIGSASGVRSAAKGSAACASTRPGSATSSPGSASPLLPRARSPHRSPATPRSPPSCVRAPPRTAPLPCA